MLTRISFPVTGPESTGSKHQLLGLFDHLILTWQSTHSSLAGAISCRFRPFQSPSFFSRELEKFPFLQGSVHPLHTDSQSRLTHKDGVHRLHVSLQHDIPISHEHSSDYVDVGPSRHPQPSSVQSSCVEIWSALHQLGSHSP